MTLFELQFLTKYILMLNQKANGTLILEVGEEEKVIT